MTEAVDYLNLLVRLRQSLNRVQKACHKHHTGATASANHSGATNLGGEPPQSLKLLTFAR